MIVAQLRGIKFKPAGKYVCTADGRVNDALDDVMEWLGFGRDHRTYGWHLARDKERVFKRATD